MTARPYRLVLFGVAAVAAAILFAFAVKAILVVFGGVLFGLVLRGLADLLARRTHIRYGACLAFVVVLIVGGMAAFAIVAGPHIAEEALTLVHRLPEAAHDIFDRMKHSQPAEGALPTASGAVMAVGSSLEVAGAFAVVFFVGLYGAARPQDYARMVLALSPDRERMKRVLEETNRQITRWLLGRLVAMTFVGVTCAIAFALLGVPLAAALAVIAGLLTFVEYIGAIASAIPPIVLAFTKSPTTALAVLGVFTVIHVIEGYVLTPLLARAAVRLPPAATLAAQVVLGALIGTLGLTFATPFLVIVVTAVRTWRSTAGDHVERDEPDEQGEHRDGRGGGETYRSPRMEQLHEDERDEGRLHRSDAERDDERGRDRPTDRPEDDQRGGRRGERSRRRLHAR